MAVIYIATNRVNGKSYIGQSRDFNKRKRYHLTSYSRCHAFHSAIKKYGHESFTWDILAEDIESQELLDLAEEYFIWNLRTISPNGYNIRHGGFGGGAFSEETRRRLSESQRGRKFSEDRRLKQCEVVRKLWSSDDFRKKHKESMRLVCATPEWKSKNDIKARWETRRKNNPNWKEDARVVVLRVTATKEWKESNRKAILERYSNQNWIRSIENKKSRCVCVETGIEYPSQKEAAIAMGCLSTSINRACRVPTRTAGGFHWKRVEK